MVKGISKQVIVVNSPDQKIFEQAIFILSEDAVAKHAVTDELLLEEAKRIVGTTGVKGRRAAGSATIWAAAGAFVTGLVWILSTVI